MSNALTNERLSTAIAMVCFPGAVLTMLLHLVGLAAGWWGGTSVTWVVALVFMLGNPVAALLADNDG